MLGQQLDIILYHVHPGDSLSRIISRYYGAVSPQKRQAIIAQIQKDNPRVKNPNHIVPNQLLFIDIPPSYCAAPVEERATPALKNVSKQQLKALQTQWNASSPKGQALLASLTPFMLGGGQMMNNSLKTVLSSNTQYLHSIISHYEAYKSGNIEKGQYDYARRKAIAKLEVNMGPVGRFLTHKRRYRQILRISRKKGRTPASNITREISRMSRLSKFAAGGSIVLAGLDLKLSCDAIGQADTQLEKNEIFAETLGGLTAGAIYGTAVAIIFAATPVGWVVALVLAAGSVAYGSLGKQAGRYAYDTKFRSVDLLSKTGISHLCG